MEKKEIKPVVYSFLYPSDLQNIYTYGTETFGIVQADNYEHNLKDTISRLSANYMIYPECRWLRTKGRIYRNIILDSHVIIYRIKSDRIEVLRILHSHSSITRIRTTRSVKF